MKTMTVYQTRISGRTFVGSSETLERHKAEANLDACRQRYHRNGRELAIVALERPLFEPGDWVYHQQGDTTAVGQVRAIREGALSLTAVLAVGVNAEVVCSASPVDRLTPGVGREVTRLATAEEIASARARNGE